MTPQSIRLVLGSRIVWIDVVQAVAEDLATALGVDEDGRFAISMALREGVNNAIVHGNRRDETKSIELLLVPHHDRLEIRIKDEGAGFDQNGLPDPLSPQNLLSSSGRGVFLIRSYMDEVDLSRAGLPGGEIRMSKSLAAETRSRVSPDPAAAGETRGTSRMRASARQGVTMSMKTEFEQKGNVTIVHTKGKITIGEGDVKLRETIEDLITSGKKNILLDLGGVSFMDSSGVGELVGCYTTVMNRGGKLKLLNLTKKIKDLLMVTQLITVFECYSDEQEALTSFEK